MDLVDVLPGRLLHVPLPHRPGVSLADGKELTLIDAGNKDAAPEEAIRSVADGLRFPGLPVVPVRRESGRAMQGVESCGRAACRRRWVRCGCSSCAVPVACIAAGRGGSVTGVSAPPDAFRPVWTRAGRGPRVAFLGTGRVLNEAGFTPASTRHTTAASADHDRSALPLTRTRDVPKNPVANCSAVIALGVFNTDRERALESFRRLAALAPSTACFGHGDPLTDDAADILRASADRASADRGSTDLASADRDSGLQVEHG